jgi:hypothetical protein
MDYTVLRGFLPGGATSPLYLAFGSTTYTISPEAVTNYAKVGLVGVCVSRTPSITPTKTPTVTPTRSITPSPTITPTRTITPSKTRTPSGTPQATPTPSLTPSTSIPPTPSITPTRSITPSRTPSISITRTRSITPTRSKTPQASATPSFTPSRTRTPSISPTRSITPSTANPCQEIFLSYDGSSASTACASLPSSYYSTEGTDLCTLTNVYATNTCVKKPPAGYYVDAFGSYRYWDGSSFTISCTNCPL